MGPESFPRQSSLPKSWTSTGFPTATKLNGYVGTYLELKRSGNSSHSKSEITERGNSYLDAQYLCVLLWQFGKIGSSETITKNS